MGLGAQGIRPSPGQMGQHPRPAAVDRRAALRACLYMAALAAVRGANPAVAGFYERLRQAGKPAKLALTACMRKLVVTS